MHSTAKEKLKLVNRKALYSKVQEFYHEPHPIDSCIWSYVSSLNRIFLSNLEIYTVSFTSWFLISDWFLQIHRYYLLSVLISDWFLQIHRYYLLSDPPVVNTSNIRIRNEESKWDTVRHLTEFIFRETILKK
jgi:hypothetical protein